jgi:hypothetical protein
LQTDSACTVAEVVAVGRSATRSITNLRSRHLFSFFRLSGAATHPSRIGVFGLSQMTMFDELSNAAPLALGILVSIIFATNDSILAGVMSKTNRDK